MKYQERKKAVLLLSDGTFFEGYAIGHTGTTTGELCFNTGMTGYQEIFTDPSYYGQIMVTTHPHIGNYGVHENEAESSGVMIAGLVVKNYSWTHSRKDASASLQQYLEDHKLVGIGGIDTRRLVRKLRDEGAMNGIISSEVFDHTELELRLAQVPDMKGLELSSKVTTEEPYFYGSPDAGFRVAALDLGIKTNILRCLAERNCYVKVFPMTATPEEMAAFEPHGYFVSNGPGDPAAMPNQAATVRALQDTGKPLFGICLGHQMLAMANGLGTFKMHHGHRGINHPVFNLVTTQSEISSQNHGFAVKLEDAEAAAEIEVTHRNLNDHTCEGIRVKGLPAFSVQYHPEASPGPHDSRYLFDQFVGLMEKARQGALV